MVYLTNRKNDSASFGELSKEWLRNRRSRGSNEDGVERRKFRQTQCAIAAVHVHVDVPQPCESLRCRHGKLRPPLDGEYFLGKS